MVGMRPYGGTILAPPPVGAKIRARKDAIGRVSIIGPIGVVEPERRGLVIIGAMIEVIDGPVAATVGKPSEAADRGHADFGGDHRPDVVGLRRFSQGP